MTIVLKISGVVCALHAWVNVGASKLVTEQRREREKERVSQRKREGVQNAAHTQIKN